eukprot:TRINITY_DN2139_c0_g1_i5.p1 TRINITY_DN2139_c0_g1~~TRINITY_DN2139_c0_g1_i5.p1  ORF type:complete len:327 (+),score=83.36 TRINITY_DN2139_c0_g1_i5:66-1046(+)
MCIRDRYQRRVHGVIKMGFYLSSPNKEKHTVSGQSKDGRFRYVASGMQGWRVNMEDAHLAVPDLTPDCSLFGVFDGHGGPEVAKFVERHFVEELKANSNFKSGNMELALKETFLKMDELLQTKEGKDEVMKIKQSEGEEDRYGGGSGGNGEESYAGCTANVSLIYKNELYVANAGDSRSVLCTKGTAKEMSKDHKPDDEKEKDRVIKAGGYVSEGRINGNLNLSRAIGDLEYKKNSSLKVNQQLIIAEPDIQRITLTSNDEFILMGCDGIWETWSVQKMCDFISDRIKQGKPEKDIIEDLLDSNLCLLYTSPSPRDRQKSRMPSSA